MLKLDSVRGSLSEHQQFCYVQWLESRALSVALRERQFEGERWRERQKEMGKRYFAQKQRSEDLQSKLNALSSSFSSRFSAIQCAPRRHRPTKSTVNELASIEQQFRDLLKAEPTTSYSPKHGAMDSAAELAALREAVSLSEQKVESLKAENERIKSENERLQKLGIFSSLFLFQSDLVVIFCVLLRFSEIWNIFHSIV